LCRGILATRGRDNNTAAREGEQKTAKTHEISGEEGDG